MKSILAFVLFSLSAFAAERRASDYLNRPDDWFKSEEAARIIENVLSFQSVHGDWQKNMDTVSQRFEGDAAKIKGTLDNGATLPELRLLARAFVLRKEPKLEAAFQKGLKHVLDAQYPNGGWPQTFPVSKGYDRHITFNDNCMLNLMHFVRDVGRDPVFSFIDEQTRERSRRAFDRGIDCILKCQIRVNGKLTAWCAQQDEIDFSPRPARAYELVSLSGSESSGLVRLLMSLENPGPEVIQAVDAAVEWMDSVKLTDVKQVLVDDPAAPKGKDKRIVEDVNAKPMWARFYDLKTMKPMFVDRDGVPKEKLSEIGYERRNGYAWLGEWPAAVLAEHVAWKKKVQQPREKVSVMRVPEGGIQPQVAVSTSGVVHLIYYKGNDRAGDIFYAKQNPGEKIFSKAIQVNSRPGSAIAAGTIRGAQLAVGKNDRVHIIWNGGEGAEKARVDGGEITPLVYTRLNDAGSAFEPERNLITYAGGLDGGSSIAADPMGNVYATWHGRAPNSPEGEAGRAVFISRSTDDGKSFRRESPAIFEPTGACGCCGMRAFADSDGAMYILYRGAAENVHRDEILLISPKPGAPFAIANKHPWVLQSCPMSSASFAPSDTGVVGAWETAGQIFFATAAKSIGPIFSPSGNAKRKHPVVATNSKGETIVAWTEGTAWAKGGDACWQIFDRKGEPISDQSRAEGLPVWSLVAAYAQPGGNFVVVY